MDPIGKLNHWYYNAKDHAWCCRPTEAPDEKSNDLFRCPVCRDGLPKKINWFAGYAQHGGHWMRVHQCGTALILR